MVIINACSLCSIHPYFYFKACKLFETYSYYSWTHSNIIITQSTGIGEDVMDGLCRHTMYIPLLLLPWTLPKNKRDFPELFISNTSGVLSILTLPWGPFFVSILFAVLLFQFQNIFPNDWSGIMEALLLIIRLIFFCIPGQGFEFFNSVFIVT